VLQAEEVPKNSNSAPVANLMAAKNNFSKLNIQLETNYANLLHLQWRKKAFLQKNVSIVPGAF
jgi:hypothetical protein